MNTTAQIAKHLREVHFGGNWTGSNLQEQLADVTWEQAATTVHSFNTIAALVFHINYYAGAILGVLSGNPLGVHDKYSFDHPPVRSQEDWENMVKKCQDDAESVAALIEQLPENRLGDYFADAKYGSYYRNLHGLIEHTHYHLGQIALVKKLVQADLR